MWEMILWCLLYQWFYFLVSPSPCHHSCSLHSFDYSQWESGRQEDVWEVFYLPVSFLPFRTSKAPKIECALGGLACSCHSWDPFSSPEAFLPSPLTPSWSLGPEWLPLPWPSASTFFDLFTWYWNHSTLCRFHGFFVDPWTAAHQTPLPSRLLCLWNSPGENTGVVCYFLLQGFFLIQGSNPRLLNLLHWQMDSLPLCSIAICLQTPWVFLDNQTLRACTMSYAGWHLY